MGGAHRRAYVLDGRIRYSVVSSKMNQLHQFKCTRVGRNEALVRQGSANNRDLQTWACLADFRCRAEASSGSLSSILLFSDPFDAFCEKFHIPEEVHPVLPNRGDTIHERPAGKIGLYTRYFDSANFRLPLSTFLVDILRYFRINISQLSVIGAAKVSHFEILCRVYEIVPTVGLFRCLYVNSKKNGWISFSKRSDNVLVCYTKPLDSLKNWHDHFFWVDSFAWPALFSWHTAKNVTRDPASVAADFNARDYATLVAHPSPFQKFLEEFLCLVGLSRHYTLDEETYPRFLCKNREGGIMDIEVKRIPLVHHIVSLRRRFSFLYKRMWDLNGKLTEFREQLDFVKLELGKMNLD
nr:hypothetical protein [Tanacetum cinerariifolium]